MKFAFENGKHRKNIQQGTVIPIGAVIMTFNLNFLREELPYTAGRY